MSLAPAPRPLSVHLFAALFATQGVAAFINQITHLSAAQLAFSQAIGWIHFDRDLTIVTISARLTIALIPVLLVWMVASRIARWLVLALALGKCALLARNLAAISPDDTIAIGSVLLSLAGAALLFTPAAARWFVLARQPAV